jgi:hypothetical protein
LSEHEIPDLDATARHEAGHAVAAYILHIPCLKLSTIRQDDSLARAMCVTWSDWLAKHIGEWSYDDLRTRRRLENEAIMILAGDAAVSVWKGSTEYREEITELLQAVLEPAPPIKAARFKELCDSYRAAEPMSDPRQCLCLLACLVDSEVMTVEEVYAYMGWLTMRAHAMMSNEQNRARVEALALALMTRREVGQRKIREIIRASS